MKLFGVSEKCTQRVDRVTLAVGWSFPVLALVNARIGLSWVFLLVTIGAIRHRKTPSQNTSVNILYWGISMMLVSLMVGYLSAMGGKLIWETEKQLGASDYSIVKFFSIAPSMYVELKGTDEMNTICFSMR